MTKQQLIKEAIKKVKTLNKKELENFLELNCCPHKHTERCGMDNICKDCGDWC